MVAAMVTIFCPKMPALARKGTMVPFRASAGILGQKMVTMAATILLLQQMFILPNTGHCNKCQIPIESDYKRNKNYIYWTCSNCKTKTALRSNTVLANSHLKLERFVLLMYCFSDRNRTYKQIINEACLPCDPEYKECSMSTETVCKWNKYFTYICCKDYEQNYEQIGGVNEIVEIDESMFGKLKYGRGDPTVRRRTWVFGGVDRRTGRSYLRVCPQNKRTKKALWPIILAHTTPGTMIYSDGWRAYRKLPTLGFQHKWVDHTAGYVHPDDYTVNTNKIEGLWQKVKQWLPQSGPYDLEKNLKLFLWFESQKHQGKNPFWSLVKLVSENNSTDILKTAVENTIENEEGHTYDNEEDTTLQDEAHTNEEEEDDDSGSETEDEEESTLLYSCPFCMHAYKEKAEVVAHMPECRGK